MIERNTTIPTKKSQTFSTAADNQTAVDVHVLQGERSMAADNITLGRFQLDGIPPARRGMPQIEVTFDIDANGIVNVSAMDKGTGKKQHITITASTNLSEEEIKAKVAEGEKFREEDEKRKKVIEVKNESESLIYEIEKSIEELGDQVSEEEKTVVNEKKEALKKAIETNELAAIEDAKKALTEAFPSEGVDDVVDAEYEVVEDDE